MSEQQAKKQDSNLIELNPQLSLADGVYQNTDTQIRSPQLSNYLQLMVNECFGSVSDLSLFSLEIEKRLLTDELRAALSPAPVNFLLGFDFENIGHTLDLSQDFGGVSHFLANKVSSIDSIKIDLGKAQLSTKRCAAFSNINTVSEDISLLSFGDDKYDLIIVSQLEDLGLDKHQQTTLIRNLQLALSRTGRLVINVRNRERLNKWISPGSQLTDYHDLYNNEVSTDFNHYELDAALKGAGFLHWDCYTSFSTSRSIQNLLSKKYLESNAYSLNHFNRLGGLANDKLNEYLLFKNLKAERGQTFDLASRFVMIASASATRSRQLYDSDFIHFSGTGRKPQWRATTQCRAGSNEVTKTRLHPNFVSRSSTSSKIKLKQTTDVQQFKNGTLLLEDWLSALLSNNPASTFKNLVSEYSQWLEEFENDNDFSARAYDVLPFNIIVDKSQPSDDTDGSNDHRNFHIIDPEWVVDAEFGADFILFRALFWFAFENKSLLKELAEQTGILTIGLFVLHYMESVDSHDQLSKFVQMEEEIQRQIGLNFRNKSIEYALLQTFDGEPLAQRLQPACQVSWSDNAGIVDEHNSVFLPWKASSEEQILNNAAPNIVKGKDTLRIDPIASMGLFTFSSVKLLAQDGSIIWQLASPEEIDEASQGLNVSLVKNADNNPHFVALNEDPHFLFDLSQLKKRQAAEIIEVTFSLLHNQYYDNSLTTLSNAVSQQNVTMFRQVGVVDTKLAEIQTLSSKLANVDQHRQALKASMHQAQQDHAEHAKNLTQALEIQTERMRQLESNVVIRTILRARRLASRLVGRYLHRR